MYYFLLIIIINLKKLSIAFSFKDILQYFKFVNWWIRGFVFWCHEQITYNENALIFTYFIKMK